MKAAGLSPQNPWQHASLSNPQEIVPKEARFLFTVNPLLNLPNHGFWMFLGSAEDEGQCCSDFFGSGAVNERWPLFVNLKVRKGGKRKGGKSWESQHDYWLVVSTPLKNMSQLEGLSHILWKIKMFQTTNQIRDVFSGDLGMRKMMLHPNELMNFGHLRIACPTLEPSNFWGRFVRHKGLAMHVALSTRMETRRHLQGGPWFGHPNRDVYQPTGIQCGYSGGSWFISWFYHIIQVWKNIQPRHLLHG